MKPLSRVTVRRLLIAGILVLLTARIVHVNSAAPPPDTVTFWWTVPGNWDVSGSFNLDTRTISVTASGASTDLTLAPPSTGRGTTISEDRARQIRECLQELPWDWSLIGAFNDSVYRSEYHVAFQLDGVTHSYSYARNNVPPAFRRLLQLLDLPNIMAPGQ